MDLLSGLNDAQRAAVTAKEGPALILAGPGSGKTRVLTNRVAWLIQEQQVKPYNIMAVTFTNKAAKEMRHRIEATIGAKQSGLQIGTFHSTCARILRIEVTHTPYNEEFVIWDTDDQLGAVTQAMNELNVDVKKFTPRRVLGIISTAKNEMQTAANFVATDYVTEVASRVYMRYQDILLDSNALDFDDLLLQMMLLLQKSDTVREKYQRRYQHVLVDEFQDTNQVQYELVKLFGAPQNNIFAVGDEDQSIYAFRGADYRNVMRFEEDFPERTKILLEQNYRSTQTILDVARSVIDKNVHRTPKSLFTDRPDDWLITVHEAYNDDYEAQFIIEQIDSLLRSKDYDYNDIAVMYRTNAQSRVLEELCVKEGIPYTLVGGVGFYKRREIRDLLAYLRVVHNPDDRMSFQRIVNVPKRGIGKKSLQDFQLWAATNNLSYGDALQKLIDGEKTPLSTRTAKKFAEFGELLRGWSTVADEEGLITLFDRIRQDSGYTHFYLEEISDTSMQAADREENIDQLRTKLFQAQESDMTLGEFLIEESLVSDVDSIDAEADKITLLTLHAAKGLEYPVVFIAGIEEGLLPHVRAYDEEGGIEEERRLFYVGITRAKDQLYLSYAFRRMFYGSNEERTPSQFLVDIPNESIEGAPPTLRSSADRYRQMTTWDSPKSRLQHDMEQFQSQTHKEPHESNEKIRSKIIAFPGAKSTQFRDGMRVKHPIFGQGIVIQSKRSGDDEEVTVNFSNPAYGLKTLLASLANMTIVER